jgi:hypothetical protein
MVVYYYDLTIKPSRVHTVNYVFVMCFLWHTTNYDFAMCFLCTRQNNNFLSSTVRIRYGHYGLWCAFYWHTTKNRLCRVHSIGKLRRRGFAVCLLEAHGKRRQKNHLMSSKPFSLQIQHVILHTKIWNILYLFAILN